MTSGSRWWAQILEAGENIRLTAKGEGDRLWHEPGSSAPYRNARAGLFLLLLLHDLPRFDLDRIGPAQLSCHGRTYDRGVRRTVKRFGEVV